MSKEDPGQTLQATALVHEAYIRLTDVEKAQHWDSRGHFFGAAAEAMRRILVDSARRKKRPKHGGGDRFSAGTALPSSAYNSGPVWLAESSPQDSLIRNTKPVYPGAFAAFPFSSQKQVSPA